MVIEFTVINLNIFSIISIASADINVIRNQRRIVYRTAFILTNNFKPTIYINKVYETIDDFPQLKTFISVL